MAITVQGFQGSLPDALTWLDTRLGNHLVIGAKRTESAAPDWKLAQAFRAWLDDPMYPDYAGHWLHAHASIRWEDVPRPSGEWAGVLQVNIGPSWGMAWPLRARARPPTLAMALGTAPDLPTVLVLDALGHTAASSAHNPAPTPAPAKAPARNSGRTAEVLDTLAAYAHRAAKLYNGGDTPNDAQRAQLMQAIADALYLLDITPSELAALAPNASAVK
jgi:hypothetical protein